MMTEKKKILNMLRTSKVLYLILSKCSHMPYVVCDEETFDDQVLLFFQEEDAKRAGEKLNGEGEPVQIVKLENAMLLSFYTGLFSMGVNCLSVNPGLSEGLKVQLNELVTRPSGDELPEGRVRVENPEFHLTALYFVQKFRKNSKAIMTEELQELNEEMMAHFQRGRYIVAVQEGQGIPVLKQKDGKIYQPVFTDFQEFQKFNREKTFRASVIEAEKIPDILVKGTIGVAINPFGANILLNIQKKQR